MQDVQQAVQLHFLLGGGIDEVAHTLVNSIAITSGIICDGAKPSCAAKIASSVDAGILGYEMYRMASSSMVRMEL